MNIKTNVVKNHYSVTVLDSSGKACVLLIEAESEDTARLIAETDGKKAVEIIRQEANNE